MSSAEMIAERLMSSRDGAKVRVGVGQPRNVGQDEWACSVYVIGIAGEREITEAVGVDSVQALVLGIAMLRARVSSLHRKYRFSWIGGDDIDASFS